MVGEIADLAVVAAPAQVVHDVDRGDDRLGLEDDGRRGDPGHRPQRLGDGVDLGLVLARRAQPLPDEGDGVEPDHVDAEVGEEQDDVGELVEDVGVRPVEVPLPRVERRPHPPGGVVVPREAARGEVGEHLGQRALVGVGQLAVGEDAEVGAVVRIAATGRLRPLVLAGDVVEHEVEAQADAPLPQRGGQPAQVVDGAQVGADRAVVGDGVPAVVGTRPGLEQRHQVQVGDAELLQVVGVLGDAVQVAGEAIGVGGVAEHRGCWNQPGRAAVRGRGDAGRRSRSANARAASTARRSARAATAGGSYGPAESLDEVVPPAGQPERRTSRGRARRAAELGRRSLAAPAPAPELRRPRLAFTAGQSCSVPT